MSAAEPLRIAVLGASGATGRLIVAQALGRGHAVDAIVRTPERSGLQPADRLIVHRGDVHDAASIAAVLTPDTVVVSGLGVSGTGPTGTLAAGAHAVVDARPRHVVWLGAIGTGASATAVARPVHRLLRAMFGAEYADKVTADGVVRDAGGTVLHAGPLTNGRRRPAVGVPLEEAPRRLLPRPIARATVAAVLLDEAESRSHGGRIVLPRPSR